ncbi:MAG: transglutaminase-like putative cysteine protease [Gammaproteobacteria bacterium]|jgi:transglutaminase-like putative cysteine protease
MKTPTITRKRISRQRARPWPRAPSVARTLPTRHRERLLQPESGIESGATAVQELAQILASTRPETTPAVEHIITQVADRIALAYDVASPHDASSALRTGCSSRLGRTRLAVALLRASQIPARVVSGVVLDETRKSQPHLWLEAFHDGRWHAYDPEYGDMDELPASYVPMNS